MTQHDDGSVASFLAELEATFQEELDDRLRSMEAALLVIERPPNDAEFGTALESFARDAHTIKGSAQLVGRDALARVAHALEARLELNRATDGHGPIDAEPLFEAVAAMEQLRRHQPGELDVEQLIVRLDGSSPSSAGARARDVSETPTAPPPPSPAPAPATSTAPSPSPGPAVQAGHNPPSAPGRAGRKRGAPATVSSTAPGDPSRPEVRAVRVSTERLDAVMSRSADLSVLREAAGHRAAVLRTLARRLDPAIDADFRRRLRAVAREARVDSERLAVVTDGLESDLLDLRLVPVATVFREFPRHVRDLARRTGKEVRLEALGWETPMDRELVERLREPVMHLLRNAVDHGIEPPEDRRAAGKPATGTIILEARPRAGGITIEVRDDGRGIDLDRVRARAQEVGLAPGAAETDAPTLGLIFQPGISTAETVTDVSGRGIGLDAVRDAIQSLEGTVDVRSEAGKGARFVLRLPLTLVATTVLVLWAGGRRFAFAMTAIERAVAVRGPSIVSLGDRDMLEVPGGPVVLADLDAIVGMGREAAHQAIGTGPGSPDGEKVAIVLATSGGRVGVIVDRVESEREVTLKGFGPLLGTPALLAGAAVLGDDDLLLVLDAEVVTEQALGNPGRTALAARRGESMDARTDPPGVGSGGVHAHPRPADQPVRVLVVDDSITTRTLERSILAAAGFEVLLAVNGEDALRVIRGQQPDIVVTDVDMPVLDGIELTRRLRDADVTRDLPIILVTSLDASEQRERGMLAGADAYLTKQAFDQQQLIGTIHELVG